jgi:hypothetical protein
VGRFAGSAVKINIDWDGAVRALALVSVGQQLGANTELARCVHDLIAVVLVVFR